MDGFQAAGRAWQGLRLLHAIPCLPGTLPHTNPSLEVQVSVSHGLWTAECDAPGLVSEATDLEI